jgi:hypothetical protein
LSLVSLTIFWFNVVDILLATSPLFVFKSAIGFEEKIASLPGLLGRVWFQSPIGRSAVPFGSILCLVVGMKLSDFICIGSRMKQNMNIGSGIFFLNIISIKKNGIDLVLKKPGPKPTQGVQTTATPHTMHILIPESSLPSSTQVTSRKNVARRHCQTTRHPTRDSSDSSPARLLKP